MKIAVSNSSPLILLAKINMLEILSYFFEKILIPPEVYHEVVEIGIEQGQGDAYLVKDFVEKKIIEIKSPKEMNIQPFTNNSLHQGELEVIKLAYSIPTKIILLDDEEARIFGRSLGLKVKGTLGLLIDYRREGKIEKDRAIELLNRLNSIMYLSGELFTYVLSKLD